MSHQESVRTHVKLYCTDRENKWSNNVYELPCRWQ